MDQLPELFHTQPETFVIYHTDDSSLVNRKRYDTLSKAKAARTRERKQTSRAIELASTSDYYGKIEQQVERVNLMSGKKFKESINTPMCCSPASETYWSM